MENQAPPRSTRAAPECGAMGSLDELFSYHLRSYPSWHHSIALPCMSNRPNGLGSFDATGCGAMPLLFLVNQAYWSNSDGSSPNEYCVVVPARQAYSHSASVGRREPKPAV